ncbi:methyltransferase domain-containing protein [Nonomuraea sp. NPDC005501]|uniref:methyltransferase domain-containing protein n=1 Tax=Nonomuraea sp. NPDC005501 TaxID=3156884 RepID=UPI0033B636D6
MSNTSELITRLDELDGVAAAVALRARSYELLRLGPGAGVVDVGCGTGRAVAELAERGCLSIGVDVSDEMIAVARRRWPEGDFRTGDAYALPLDDGEVAGYRADKVMHELADAGRAVREAGRVLAPGGRIVLTGQDWDAFVIDSGDPALTRTIVHAGADQIPDPRAARRYRNLLLSAGFGDVHVEIHTMVFTDAKALPLLTGRAEAAFAVGAVTLEQRDAWTAEQKERARRGRLFLAVPLFVASATWNRGASATWNRG